MIDQVYRSIHMMFLLDHTRPREAHLGGSGSTSTNLGRDTSSRFDSKMILILAGLLCAFAIVLGLHSITRCLIHYWRITTSGEPDGIGLNKKELKRIPLAVYGPEVGIPVAECSICLVEFVGGEVVRVLPKCNHGFHVSCIDTWLALHSSCPTCRLSCRFDDGNERLPE